MELKRAVAEVADSEAEDDDKLLTSSPAATPHEAGNKLHTSPAREPSQEPQDAFQAAAHALQAPGRCAAAEACGQAESLGDALIDAGTSQNSKESVLASDNMIASGAASRDDTVEDVVAVDSGHSLTDTNTSSNTETSTNEPSKTPQEVTLAELQAKKASLIASLAAQPKIQELHVEPTDAEVTVAANRIVNDHIKLLHEYNEIKDVGQGLMGLIADQRGARIVDVQEEFGIDAKD